MKHLHIWDTAPRGARGRREALHGEDGVFPPLEGVRVQGLSSGEQGHTANPSCDLLEIHELLRSNTGWKSFAPGEEEAHGR